MASLSERIPPEPRLEYLTQMRTFTPPPFSTPQLRPFVHLRSMSALIPTLRLRAPA